MLGILSEVVVPRFFFVAAIIVALIPFVRTVNVHARLRSHARVNVACEHIACACISAQISVCEIFCYAGYAFVRCARTLWSLLLLFSICFSTCDSMRLVLVL